MKLFLKYYFQVCCWVLITVEKDENVTSIYKIWTEKLAWDPVCRTKQENDYNSLPKETILSLDIITRREKKRLYYPLYSPSLQWFIRYL